MNTATAVQPVTAPITITLPTLAEDERYLGLILKDDGTPDYHAILLPGETRGTWKHCMDWAKERGVELLNRRELSLAFTNARAAFEQDWYWSSEEHAGDADSAWLTGFGYGYQLYDLKSDMYLARAVRRDSI